MAKDSDRTHNFIFVAKSVAIRSNPQLYSQGQIPSAIRSQIATLQLQKKSQPTLFYSNNQLQILISLNSNNIFILANPSHVEKVSYIYTKTYNFYIIYFCINFILLISVCICCFNIFQFISNTNFKLYIFVMCSHLLYIRMIYYNFTMHKFDKKYFL